MYEETFYSQLSYSEAFMSTVEVLLYTYHRLDSIRYSDKYPNMLDSIDYVERSLNELVGADVLPVSYTHLDVYKRQLYFTG